jgi:uncharacterized protein YndB with AHSA1/START domain
VAVQEVQLYGCRMEPGIVRKTIEIDAPRWAVWEALTDPTSVASWLGSPVDLVFVAGESGSMVVDGSIRQIRVRELVDERRLVWEWWRDDEGDGVSEVSIALSELEGRTVVEVVERRGASAACTLGPAEVAAWDRRLVGLQLRLSGALVSA